MNKPNKHKDLGEKICKNIYEGARRDMLSNKDLVEILILVFDLLNIMTISEYAKFRNKTYSGVKRFCKHIIKVNQFTFVADND